MSIGGTLPQILRKETLNQVTFLCCGLVLSTTEAMCLHFGPTLPGALTSHGQPTEELLESKDNFQESWELFEYKPVIVEEEDVKDFEVVEQDPLLVDESPAVKVSNPDGHNIV